jgi:hydrogenase expression/formation protein HypC
MCLAIPARLIEYLDDGHQYATVDLAGVRRRVNTTLLTGPDTAQVGDYVLIHVGFALSRVSEEEAQETLRILEAMGAAYADELVQIRTSQALFAEGDNQSPAGARSEPGGEGR